MPSTVSFEDQALAARFRDVIHREAIKAINSERPPYKYGTVTQIDLDLRRVLVSYPGDPGPPGMAGYPVALIGVVPTSIGQTVQVSGRQGDRFVSGVVGSSATVDAPSDVLTDPIELSMTSGIFAVSADWNAIDGASRYIVQFANDENFTVLVREFETSSNTFTLNNIDAGQTIYGRVAGKVGRGDGASRGEWSNVDSAVALGWPDAIGTDGDPPSDSPDAFVSEGLGYLLAEWLPVSNADEVTYEVHISTTSGFTPGPSTKVGETTGTFFFLKNDAARNPLMYDVTYFVRLVAKDADGVAPVAGAQGHGQIQKVELGDVGNVPWSELTDGAAPTESPTPTVTGAVGALYLDWEHVENADALSYEVHIGITPGFTVDANSYVGETPSNFFFIRRTGPGLGGSVLTYGTTYYVKIRTKDRDGFGPIGGTASGVIQRIERLDIEERAIDLARLDTTVTAQALVVGNFDNLVANPGFETGELAPHATTGTWQVADSATNPELVRAGKHAAWFRPPANFNGIGALYLNGQVTDKPMHVDCSPGDQFMASIWARPSGSAGMWHPTQLLLIWYNADGGLITTSHTWIHQTAGNTTFNFTWAKFTVQGTAPAGAAYVVAAVHIYADGQGGGAQSQWAFDDGYMRRKIEGQVVVDGSVTANLMAANSITAANGALGALTVGTGHIVDLAVSTAKIANLAVTTGKINDLAVSTAKIANLSVTTGKIADLAVLTAKIGDLQVTNAKIHSMEVAKLVAGTMSAQYIILSNSTASYIRSSNYVANTSGWRVLGTGAAEFNDALFVRGSIWGAGLYGIEIIGGTLQIGTNAFRVDANGVVSAGGATWETSPFVLNAAGSILSRNLTNNRYTVVQSGQISLSVIGNGGGTIYAQHNASDQLMDALVIVAGWSTSTYAGLYRRPSNKGRFMIVNGDMLAENYLTSSSIRTKDVESRMPFDPLTVIRGAPVSAWRRRGLAKGRDKDAPPTPDEYVEPAPPTEPIHISPMAEDLPEEIAGNGEVSLVDLVGLLWGAVDQLASRVDELGVRCRPAR